MTVRPAIMSDPLWLAGELADALGLGPDELDESLNAIARAADAETARQSRIALGVEHACAVCGCSETRACEGGCVWATATRCSRCV